LGGELLPCYIESPLNSLNNSDYPKMKMRFLATTVLAAALLFSQGGNFLVAALCPHLQSGTASCEIALAETTLSHKDMGHVGMDHSSAFNPDPSAVAAGHGIDPCSHCAVHSSKTPYPASLRETKAPKRSAGLSIPLQSSTVPPGIVGPAAVLSSRAHGPPGESTARYILISIFRI
jgi:hypothetical protein